MLSKVFFLWLTTFSARLQGGKVVFRPREGRERVWGVWDRSKPRVQESNNVRALGLTPECGNATFCDCPEDLYPTQLIREALERQKDLKPILADKMTGDDIVGTRIGLEGFREGTEACPSTQQMTTPRVATNVNHEQKFIVNGLVGLEEVRQIVRITVCDTEQGEECGAGAFGVPTECEQRFSEHKLVAVDMKENGEAQLVVDSFTFPSCCSCMIHSTFDYY